MPRLSILAIVALSVAVFTHSAVADEKENLRLALNIKAAPLGEALEQLSKQTGLQVLHRDIEHAKEPSTPGVKGTLTVNEALDRLLTAAGYRYEFVNDRTIRVWEAKNANGDRPLALAQSRPRETQVAAINEPSSVSDSSRESRNQQTIDEVVVTGTHIRSVVPASPVMTLTRTDIDRSAATSASDLLRLLPQNFGGGQNAYNNMATGNPFETGVNPGAATGIDLRGLGTNATLVLLNGRRLAPAGVLGSPDVSSIPLVALERVEVLTDGATASYGSDAVGGVVNFILRKRYEGAQTGVSYGGASGSRGTEFRLSQALGTTWSSGDAFLSYDYSNRRPIYTSDRSYSSSITPPATLAPSAVANSALATVSQQVTDGASAFFQGLYTRRDSRYISNLFGGLLLSDSQSRETQSSATAGLTFSLPADWESTFAATFARDDADVNTVSSFFGTASPASRSTFRNTVEEYELQANGTAFSIPAGAVKTAFGLGYRSLNPDIPLPTDVRDQTARYAFAELNVPLLTADIEGESLQRLAISAGVRYDDYNVFGSAVSPKFGLVMAPLKGLRLKGTWGKAFHAPDPVRLYAENDVFFYSVPPGAAPGAPFNAIIETGGNPDLQAEKSRSYTAGIEWSPDTTEKKFTVSSNYYNIDFDQRITAPSIDTLGVFTDPAYTNQVFAHPGLAFVDAVIARAKRVDDLTGGAPLGSAAFYVDGRTFNAAALKTDGVDFVARLNLVASKVDLTFNANKIFAYEIQNTPTSVSASRLGRIFYVPSLKMRAGATGSFRWLSATLFANYTHGYLNDSTIASAPVNERVSSWTTFDGQVSFDMPKDSGSVLGGMTLRLSISNLFDRDPPYARLFTPIGYDTTNADPRGRFATAVVQKQW